MGLLSDPKNRVKFIVFVSRHCNKLCFLTYLVGLAWFIALAYAPMNEKTYFSENALLPGLVDSEYSLQRAAERFYDDAKDESKKHPRTIPIDWISNEMTRLGLDTYVQNYSFSYPLNIFKQQTFTGRNVYGILRARRASNTESVVMSLPLRPPESILNKNHAGLALMLSMAKYMRAHTYWSKDIIFLVTEHEGIGIQAWLDSYHNTRASTFINGSDLLGRGGSIQAAVNLDIEDSNIDHFDLLLEGLNGQLPNLDLINTIVRLCRKEGIVPTIHNIAQHYNLESYEGFEQSLQTMLLMMWSQLSGSASGNHGLFHRYHIEAVTMMGVKEKRGRNNHGFYTMGRVMEGLFRSLNNLMERFHQSFFFYLLPSTERYVSIGMYMPPFGLLVVGCLIKAIELWASYQSSQPTVEGEETDDAVAGGDSRDQDDKKQSLSRGLLSIAPVTIISTMFGMVAYYGAEFFIATASPFKMSPGEGLLYGGVAVFITAMFYPRLLSRADKDASLGPNWKVLKSMTLIMEGLVLFSTSLMNISLATLLAVTMVPVTVWIQPTKSKLLRFLQAIPLLLIAPMTLTIIATVVNTYTKNPYININSLVKDSYDEVQNVLLMGAVENQLLGNWTWGLMTLIVLPNWLMFWGLLWTGHTSLE